MNKDQIKKYIDHTNVKPDATEKEIKTLCKEAKENGFHSVCVSAFRVKDARKFLGDSNKIALISVIGFPFGFSTTEIKVLEAKRAVKDGATEIDMVINIGKVKEHDWGFTKKEILQISKAIAPIGLKVIVEVGYLSEEELFKVSKIVKEAGAKFVKTSTGYGPRPAQLKDIKIMKKAVGDFDIKASGGVRDYKTAEAMIKAGATRIGTSSGLKIIGKDQKKKKDLSGSNE